MIPTWMIVLLRITIETAAQRQSGRMVYRVPATFCNRSRAPGTTFCKNDIVTRLEFLETFFSSNLLIYQASRDTEHFVSLPDFRSRI